MLGAIAGDIIGSVYEFENHRSKDFPLFARDATFTDDTVLTVAIAEALMEGSDYAEALKRWYRRYPNVSYGTRFRRWAESDSMGPYKSWGNGSAMRVSPVAWAFGDLETVLEEATRSAAVTHNHPEGIKGAQAVAGCIYLARMGGSSHDLRSLCEERFGYDLSESLASLRRHYEFDESCQGTVPVAVSAALEATDFEDALRNAVSVGGDSDTIACIAGAIAEARFQDSDQVAYAEIPERLMPTALPLWLVVQTFYRRVVKGRGPHIGKTKLHTSETDPLRVDHVEIPGTTARLGMTLCPGKDQSWGSSGPWRRDLDADLIRIRDEGYTTLITLMEDRELKDVLAGTLPEQARQHRLDWRHWPIHDRDVPDERFERCWREQFKWLRSQLQEGRSVALHCLGGLGRTGMVAAKILTEFGVEPVEAVQRVRAARRGAIETQGQLEYVLGRR